MIYLLQLHADDTSMETKGQKLQKKIISLQTHKTDHMSFHSTGH